MTELTYPTIAALPTGDSSDSVEEAVRAAFTERIRAEVARLLADSLAARPGATESEPGVRGATRRLRQEAAAHDREAHRFEERVAMLRQLEHDGRL
jgi:hypothetical protein